MDAQQHDTAWTAVCLLLADPQARMAAISERGFFMPLPAALAQAEDVQIPPERMLTGKTALGLVPPGEVAAVIDAWDQARRDGGSAVIVHLLDDPGRGSWVLHMTDLQASFGCFVAVCVPTAAAPSAGRHAIAGPPPGPRLARVLKDQTAVIVEVDAAICELLGWSADELLHHRSSEFVHPEDQELAIASWIEMLGTPGLGRRVRLRHARKDGSWAWFELTNHNLLEERGHVLCEMVDISQEMSTHEALRAREQLLDRLAEALPVGVVQTGAEGGLVYANSQAKRLFGPDRQNVTDLLSAVLEQDAAALAGCFLEVLGGADGAECEVSLPQEPETTHLSVVVRRLDEDGVTTGAVACFTDVTDSLRLQRELRHLATTDALTGVLNRAAVLLELDRAIERPSAGVAAVFVDLDGFKLVNDRFGHARGDDVLREVAEVLRAGCRDTDTVGRIGGDEFLVTCADVASLEAALELSERFADQLRSASLGDGSGLAASIGVAWCAAGDGEARRLIAAADTAMYRAKSRAAGAVGLAS